MELLARARVRLIKERSLKVGVRNLIPKGKGEITQAGKTDRYSSRAYKPSSVSISSDKSYCVGAYIEVLEGEPAGIGLLSYKYSPAKWVHKPAHATYDLRKGGKQWLTWSLTAQGGERVEMDVLLIYAGVIGHTQGVTIRISEVILIEGDVAPTGWIPAPEDVEADATATARVQTIMRHRDLVGIERDRLHEIYRKLRTDKRTPQDLGLRLEHLWISCSGAHAELDRACAAAIASPTDKSNEAVNRLTGTYRAKVIDMQRGIQEAEAAIREAIFSEARGVSSARLDALALDPNKWYPITIELAATPVVAREERQFGLRLTRGLFSTKGTPQEWWGHKDGYHFSLHWSVQPAGWGQRREDRRVYAYIRHYLREGTPVVSSPKQITEGSVEYVYVRGGSLYELSVVGLSGLSIQLHPEGYEWRTSPGDDTYLRRLPVLESIASIGEPRMELDILSDRLLAQLADANRAISRAQGAADTAKSEADKAKRAAQANDGKIDEAEARAIARAVEAYRRALLVEWEGLLSAYTSRLASPYLIDKQPLNQAYQAAAPKYTALKQRADAILADGKVSAAEYSQYTAAYEAYQPAARSLAQALEAAAKAMQDRLKQLAAEAAASAESRAKSHADTKASEAEQRAKTEARRAAEEAERRAKEHAERQIAHMDYLKAVLRKGKTSIQGGAVLGQYIAVADLEQVVRGYISGMLNGAFLAAGVSNHGTPQETRNVEISHDGDGHFGQLHFCGSGQDGRVDLIRPGEADPYLSLGGVLRPIQEVLLDAELRDTYVSNQADVDAYPLALSGLTRELKVFSVLRDGASCRVSGQLQAPSMRFNGAGDSQQSQRVTITTEILLQRQQPSGWIDVAVMGDTWVSGDSSQDSWSEPAKVIDLRLPNLHKGQYRLLARSRYSDNYYQLQVISQIRIMPLTILVERVSSVQQVAFTEHGFRAFYGPHRYVDIASEGDYVLSARGATDIPGVLAAGRVNARGQVLASWGARVKDRGTDNVRVSMISDNTYIVYHSIGHLDYVVQLTVQNSWNVASYYDITPWSFRVKMSYPGGSWGNAYAGEFSYVCIGTNG